MCVRGWGGVVGSITVGLHGDMYCNCALIFSVAKANSTLASWTSVYVVDLLRRC